MEWPHSGFLHFASLLSYSTFIADSSMIFGNFTWLNCYLVWNHLLVTVALAATRHASVFYTIPTALASAALYPQAFYIHTSVWSRQLLSQALFQCIRSDALGYLQVFLCFLRSSPVWNSCPQTLHFSFFLLCAFSWCFFNLSGSGKTVPHCLHFSWLEPKLKNPMSCYMAY